MNITKDFLLARGIVVNSDDPTLSRSTRETVVTQVLSYLIRSDYATQNVLGLYTDSLFLDLSTDMSSIEFREKSAQDGLRLNEAGWYVDKKVKISSQRLDEVTAITALASILGSIPAGPGDATMNCYRFYDVIRMMEGEDFDATGSFMMDEDLDFSTKWIRFKYILFIAEQIKKLRISAPIDDIVIALFGMQTYQLIPCLVAAFRLKEETLQTKQIYLAYPVLEPRDWTETALNELLSNILVKQTPEYVKILPLVSDERSFVNSSFGSARLSLPFEENEQVILTRKRRYIDFGPTINFAVNDSYGSWMSTFLSFFTGMGGIENQVSYVMAYYTTTKGYYLADQNFEEGKKLTDIYDNKIVPYILDSITDSFLSTSSGNFLSVNTDATKGEKAIDRVFQVLEDNKVELFDPILDYTARRIMMKQSVSNEGNILPMYYSIGPNGTVTFEGS